MGRAGGSPIDHGGECREEGEVGSIPDRVQEALEDSRGFGSFRERRTFNFLHLFSGREDVLGDAIREECKKANLTVKIHSVDRDKVQGADMLGDEPYGQILKDAQADFFDGGHSGYPCGAFSKARYNERGQGPPPIRPLQHVYGLPTNNSHRQALFGFLFGVKVGVFRVFFVGFCFCLGLCLGFPGLLVTSF